MTDENRVEKPMSKDNGRWPVAGPWFPLVYGPETSAVSAAEAAEYFAYGLKAARLEVTRRRNRANYEKRRAAWNSRGLVARDARMAAEAVRCKRDEAEQDNASRWRRVAEAVSEYGPRAVPSVRISELEALAAEPKSRRRRQ